MPLSVGLPTLRTVSLMHSSDSPMHGLDSPIRGLDTPIYGSDTPMYGLDIETDTSVDGLDPSVAAVVAVAVAAPDEDVVLLSDGDEEELLRGLDDLLGELDPGLLVTWNGSGFDLPFLAERFLIAGVRTGLRLWPDPLRGVDSGVFRGRWYGHDHLDGFRLYRADVGGSLGFPCGLKPMARLVGLTPVEVDRATLHLLDASAVRDYVSSDARLARELVLRRGRAATLSTDRCHPPLSG